MYIYAFSPTIGDEGNGGCLDCGERAFEPPGLCTDLPLPLLDPADPDEVDDTDDTAEFCTETADEPELVVLEVDAMDVLDRDIWWFRILYVKAGAEEDNEEMWLGVMLLLVDNKEDVSSSSPSSNRSTSSSLSRPLGIGIGREDDSGRKVELVGDNIDDDELEA